MADVVLTEEEKSILSDIYDKFDGIDYELLFKAVQSVIQSGLEEERKCRTDELDAVMLSVDKWLEGKQLENNPATRAADAREIALQAIEKVQNKLDLQKKEIQKILYDTSDNLHISPGVWHKIERALE